jgi:hypothetical protein
MSLPEQLRNQIEEANRIVEQHYGTGDGETPASEIVAPSNEGNPESGTTVEPTKSTAQPSENDQSYEHKWRTQQGIVAALNTKLAQADQRIQSMEQVIAMMQQAPQQAPQQVPMQEYLITDKDKEDFGEDMVDLALRAARQENTELRSELGGMYGMVNQLREQLFALQQQVVPTVQRVAQNQQRSANQEFMAALTEQVPNWEQVNGNARFHEWLLSPDPMTGIIRQVYLEEAHKSLDLPRVVAVFRAFLGGSATGAQTQVSGGRKAPSGDLQSQIAPGRSLSSPAPSANEARRWSRAEIQKLYDDKLRGRYVGKEADFTALERDIFAAQSEGRVTA